MAAPRFQHTVVLSRELEEAWLLKQATAPELSFNAFIAELIREALCVTVAPTSTIPLAM